MIKCAVLFFFREGHSGSLTLIIFGVITAISCVTAVGFFSDRLAQGIQLQSSVLLGADSILKSAYPLSDSTLGYLQSFPLQISKSVRFSSVVMANDIFQLSNIKAVDRHYPLKGQLQIVDKASKKTVSKAPKKGTVWLEKRLFSLLHVQLGDSIEIGNISLTISAMLLSDSLEGQDIFSFAPKILMALEDIAATGIVQPGSRIHYYYYLQGNQDSLQRLQQWAAKNLQDNQFLLHSRDNSVALRGTLDKAYQYLGLASLLSVILGGIAIALAARRYSEKHFDSSAILRCLGVQQRQLLVLHSFVLLLVAVFASIIGCLVGYLAHWGLVYLLLDLLPKGLPQPSWKPLWIGLITGCLTVLAFSLPSILRIKNVSALRVLRRELTPLPINAYISYGLACSVLVFMMWWYSNDIKLVMLMITGITVSLVLLLLLTAIVFIIINKMQSMLQGSLHFALSSLTRYRNINILQLIAFSFVLMVMLLVYLLKVDVLESWQAQLPDKTPNHFIVNIPPSQLATLKHFFEQKGIVDNGFYPLVRGRLTHINAIPVKQAVKKSVQEYNVLNRELNLSWLDTMQPKNKLVAGTWWDTQDNTELGCSVELGMAKRLGLQIGDSLQFQIADTILTVPVKSIRKVQWDSFQPNFYVLFSAGILEAYPYTLMSSFYLSTQDKGLVNDLIQTFPTLTIIEVDKIINEIKRIIGQLVLAIEYILILILFAGLAVLFSGLQLSMDERLENILLMRILGAKKRFIEQIIGYEFILLGILSVLLALIATELISYLLYQYFFHLSWQWHPLLWLVTPVIGTLLIATIGGILSRNIGNKVPIKNMAVLS